MTIKVTTQTVSPRAIEISPEALRRSQTATVESNNNQATQSTRQVVATEKPELADSGQKLAEAKKVVVQLNEQVQSVARQLQFRVDEESGRTLIKVTDRETGEIIREIPSEEMIELGHRLKELAETLHSSSQNTDKELSGLLVKRQA